MKNIFICTNEFLTEKNFDGGISNHFYRIAKTLKSKSYNPIIITSSDKNDETQLDGIKIIRVKVFNFFIKVILKLTQKIGFKGEIYPRPFFCLYQSYCLNNEIAKRIKKNDIVIYSSYQYLNYFQKNYFKSISFIWSLQKEWNYTNRDSLIQKFDSFLERKSFLKANKIISVSKLLYNKLDNELKKKTDIIFPSFTPEVIKTINLEEVKKIYKIDYEYILYFGSFIKRKGIFLLSKAIKNISKKNEKINFLFVGSDSKRRFVSSKNRIISENLEIKDRIHFLPSLRHEILYPIIKNAKIVVMPTYIDTVPSASLETMHAGGLLVASNNSSIDEYLIDNINGFLFENGDRNNLEDKLLQVLDMSDIQKSEIRGNAKKHLELNFSNKNIELLLKEIQYLSNDK